MLEISCYSLVQWLRPLQYGCPLRDTRHHPYDKPRKSRWESKTLWDVKSWEDRKRNTGAVVAHSTTRLCKNTQQKSFSSLPTGFFTLPSSTPQGRWKMICVRGAQMNNLTLITFITLKLDSITVGTSERSQNEQVRWPENV